VPKAALLWSSFVGGVVLLSLLAMRLSLIPLLVVCLHARRLSADPAPGSTSWWTQYASSCSGCDTAALGTCEPCTCDGITEENRIFHVPDSVDSIPAAAFLSCAHLETVTGMENVSSVGVGAFYTSGIRYLRW
jgi:hypothetical protein